MSMNNAAVVGSLTGATPFIVTASYTQVGVSAALGTRLVVSNSTDQNITIGYGSAGNEVAIFTVAKGQQDSIVINPLNFPVGTRFAALAQGTATTTGWLTLTLA